MMHPSVKKAGFLYVALKNNKGIHDFKNCLYSYYDHDSLLFIKDPIRGTKCFRKTDVDKAYVGEIGTSLKVLPK